MWHSNRGVVVAVLTITCLLLSACVQMPASSASKGGGEDSGPAKVEHMAGTNLVRVILTAEAARRVGIETAPIRETKVHGKLRKVVPYAAVIYDLHGETWVYTNPEPLTYVRDTISVDFIEGDLAVLSKGPPSGTVVVMVGAPELYGTESGVGE